MIALLKPIEREINGKKFILSKFPAVEGREIAMVYLDSNDSKSDGYKLNELIMFKLMCYVAIPTQTDVPLRLTTRELVNNHVMDWETLVKLEKEMMEYNCSFLAGGRVLNFQDGLAPKKA